MIPSQETWCHFAREVALGFTRCILLLPTFFFRSKLVATGDANGDICIWSLNDDLVNFNQKEILLLDNMASVMLD